MVRKYKIIKKLDFIQVREDFYTKTVKLGISSGYVKNINDYIKIKDKIYAQVVDVDEENNKLKLSIKNIDYRGTGEIINDDNYMAGFESLKDHLDDWINDKIKEIMDKM